MSLTTRSGPVAADCGVPRRLLGRYLRELREQSTVPVSAVADALGCSRPTVYRIETGQNAARRLDVAAMCGLYGAPPDLTEALTWLARQPNAPGWWLAQGEAAPAGFAVRARIEAQARSLAGYEQAQVPGLLRTEAYARALVRVSLPGADAQDTDQLVAEDQTRQLIMTRVLSPLSISMILSEAVMRYPVGGPQVLAAQLRHLADLAALPNLCLRVVRLSVGLHPGLLSGPFALLRFPPIGTVPCPTAVCLPGLGGDLYLDAPEDVQRYEGAHAAIADCALDEDATQALLLSAAKELGG
jgi:transcriptional regulator with XRE-family HTH domain